MRERILKFNIRLTQQVNDYFIAVDMIPGGCDFPYLIELEEQNEM